MAVISEASIPTWLDLEQNVIYAGQLYRQFNHTDTNEEPIITEASSTQVCLGNNMWERSLIFHFGMRQDLCWQDMRGSLMMGSWCPGIRSILKPSRLAGEVGQSSLGPYQYSYTGPCA